MVGVGDNRIGKPNTSFGPLSGSGLLPSSSTTEVIRVSDSRLAASYTIPAAFIVNFALSCSGGARLGIIRPYKIVTYRFPPHALSNFPAAFLSKSGFPIWNLPSPPECGSKPLDVQFAFE